MKKEMDDIIDYISKNKGNFEVGKFEGDIFWYNDLVFSGIGIPRKVFFSIIYQKTDLKNYWLVINLGDFERLAKEFYGKYKNNPERFRKIFYQRRNNCRKKFQNLIQPPDLNRGVYSDFVKSAQKFGAWSIGVLEALESSLAEKIKSEISNPRRREILTFPLHTSYVQEQNEELINVLQQIPRREFLMIKRGQTNLGKYKKFGNLIKKHREEWGWIFTNYGSYRLPPIPLVVRGAIELANNINKELKLLKEIKKKKKVKQRLLKKLPGSAKKLIKFFDMIVELRDRRKEFWLSLIIPGKSWLKRIAESYNLSYDDLRWLTWEEQCKLSMKNMKNFLRVINKRKVGYVVLYGYNKKSRLILTGKHVKKIAKIIFEREKNEMLEGISASLGKVSGRVKNICHTKEFKKFKEGEILVASHTTPDYVPIIKKAKAILTERGGITSHAAIVSRELGVPCIVGIKGLVENFKDGDLVEVDANKGMVKILKKKT